MIISVERSACSLSSHRPLDDGWTPRWVGGGAALRPQAPAPDRTPPLGEKRVEGLWGRRSQVSGADATD